MLHQLIKSHDNAIIFFLSCLFFCATYLVFDFYYGWIDDIIQMNMFRGTYNNARIWDFYFHHSFLSYLYAYLYKVWPTSPWYGLFMYSYLFAATFLFLKIIRVLLRRNGVPSVSLFLIFSSLLFSTLLMESIVLLIYSKVAILLSGLSLISILFLLQYSDSRVKFYRVKLLIVGLFFILGFLTRPEVSGPVIILLFLYLLIPPLQISQRSKVKLIVFILLVVGIFNVLNRFVMHSPNDPVFQWEMYQMNLSNAQNFNYHESKITQSKTDSIRYIALRAFYLYDQQQFDAKFFQKIGGGNPLSAITLKQVPSNILQEIRKARSRYPKSSLSYYNYFWKVEMFIAINILLLVLSCMNGRGLLLLKQGIFFIAFWVLIMAIAVFIKMEERVFTPLSILFTIFNVVYTLTSFKERGNQRFMNLSVLILFIGFIVSTSIMLVKLSQVTETFNKQLTTKSKIINEIKNNYSDQFIFLDIPAMGLLHKTPLQPVNLQGISFYNFGEYGSNFLLPYKNSFREFCGSSRYNKFYRCLLKRDDVVFLHDKYKISILKSYYNILYDIPLLFNKINKNSALSNINYSYIGEPLNFGYYQMKERPTDFNN